MARSRTRRIGLLTAGGDCPGLNAVIRAISKVAIHQYGIEVIGVRDGFRGLVENRTVPLDEQAVSGILTRGGTILGASRDKPHSMPMGGRLRDMTDVAAGTVRKLGLDCLVCLGGGGTAKNAYRLSQKTGVRVMTLPKTIDNDVFGTDVSFGFDTAVGIATDAIDRLHTTATSHHRMIVCEIMGHRAGWLALQSGVAGGADVILLPEIPYDLQRIAEYLLERRSQGKRFSIIAAAEGAKTVREAVEAAKEKKEKEKEKERGKERKEKGKKGKGKRSEVTESEAVDAIRADLPLKVRKMHEEVVAYHAVQEPMASRLARHLQELTGVEARVTSLGHVQRGGIPSAFDRTLCTLLGAKAADLLAEGHYDVMVAYRNGGCVPVPLADVVGRRKPVPLDHPLLDCARKVGTCFGD
jgi:ATP-dependent phosphofructokinase / diphosphate-dependent phosphofructokinase